MKAGDWIAGYAAIVATVALGWQCVTYWRTHIPILVLKFEPAVIVTSENEARSLEEAFAGKTEGPFDIEWYFDLRIINRGHGRVQVTSIRLSQDTSGGAFGWDAARRASLPLWLEPGEEQSFRFTDDDLNTCEVTGAIDIRVTVAGGKEFRTENRFLKADTLVISPISMIENIAARSDLADRIYRFEIHELEEMPIIKRRDDLTHGSGDPASPPTSS